MTRYIHIYKTLLKLNLSTLLAYKANFVNSVISSVGWGAFSVLSVLLLTSRTRHVYGWSREELLILVGAYNMFVGMFHLLFSRNFERFSLIIDYGQLDNILLKPLDSQFLLSLWFFNYTSIFRILFGMIVVIYMFMQLRIGVSILNVLGFFVFGIIGIIILYSIWFIAATFIIWSTRLSNIVELLYTINGITRYPREMFTGTSYLFLIILPIILVVTTPTQILLERVSINDIVLLCVFSFSLFFISRKFWQFALRFYTSVSG